MTPIDSTASDSLPATHQRSRKRVRRRRTRAKSQERGQSVLVTKHPLAIRWFHWINFPVLLTMVWSGLLIYWANGVFTITLFGNKLFALFPDSWYSPQAPGWFPDFLTSSASDSLGHPIRVLWSLDARLAEGMGWHFLFAWFFTINGLLYVLYLVFSGEWRKIVPHRHAVREACQVVLYDLRLTKRHPPVRKYNAAQQIAYTGVIIMGAMMVVTGVAIYKPAQQSWLTLHVLGGYTSARFIHFWITMGFVGFFLVHVGQVIRTGWNNFRGMVTGSELVTLSESQELERGSSGRSEGVRE